MCSRFALYRSKTEIMEELIPVLWDQKLFYNANWNVTPTTVIPVMVDQGDQRVLTGMQWGLTPAWRKQSGQPLINARVETAEDKPSFKSLVGRQQCIIIMDGYFEWKKEGSLRRPFLITRTDGKLLLAAGLYDTLETDTGSTYQVTMLTRPPTPQLAPIHNRMPLLLPHECITPWIRGGAVKPEDDSLAFEIMTTAVSAKVNSVHAAGPECIEPSEEQLELF